MNSNLKKILGKKIGSIAKKIVSRDKYEPLYRKYKAYTMVPSSVFKKNLELVEKFQNIQGCIVECGVWRGGMSAAMAEVLKNRKSYLYDSFEGLPEVKEIDGVDAVKWQKDTGGSSYFDNCKAEMSFAD